MMRYIISPSLGKAANRKIKELHEYVAKYSNCIVMDDLTRDAIVNELREKVDELNAAYPRTKPLEVSMNFGRIIMCCQKERPTDDYAFSILLYEVKRVVELKGKTLENKEEGGGE